MNKAVAAIPIEEREEGWRAIESAPGDDRAVLLYGALDSDWGSYPTGDNAFDEEPEIVIGFRMGGDRWFAPNNGGPGDYDQWCKPTHWQPLPSPPSAPAKGG